MSEDSWPFDQPRNAATVTVRSIANGELPVLLVIHDLDDHGWQFLTGFDVSAGAVKLVSLERVVRLDNSLLELADLPPGWQARRISVSAPWLRSLVPS